MLLYIIIHYMCIYVYYIIHYILHIFSYTLCKKRQKHKRQKKIIWIFTIWRESRITNCFLDLSQRLTFTKNLNFFSWSQLGTRVNLSYDPETLSKPSQHLLIIHFNSWQPSDHFHFFHQSWSDQIRIIESRLTK